MSVFSIAFVMVYKREDGTLIVAPYMARAATSSFDDEELTADSVKARFAETDFAKEGWSLLGEPVLSELDWQYIGMHKMQIRLEPHGKTVDVNPKLTKAAHLKSVTYVKTRKIIHVIFVGCFVACCFQKSRILRSRGKL